MTFMMECPGCGRSIEWSTGNTYRPFCSARCKGADFIGWAEEKNVIPDDSDEADFPDDAED
jgi:hypothetical protein